MKRKYQWYIMLLFICSTLFAQEPIQQYSRARIYLDQHSIFELLQLGVAMDHGVHRNAYVENDFSITDLNRVRQAGYRVTILIEDVVAYYAQQNDERNDITPANRTASCNSNGPIGPNYQEPVNFNLGSMGGYLTYQELLNNLDSMAAKYPNLISVRQAINSNDLTHEGRPIYWVRISDNAQVDENEPEALYNALHHAREPMGLSQLVYFMWYLLENYGTDPSIQHLIDQTELYFIPCINPDGYVYNQSTNPSGGGLWRKNRRNNGGSIGVDLNRNYGYNWGFNNTGSSGTASSDVYRGTSAFSEPETRNVRDFCQAHQFKLALNYHSYGNLLIYPWAYDGQETADSLFYRSVAPMMAQFNNYLTGTGTTTVGYNSNGDADDWLYGEQIAKNKILSFTPEAGPSNYGFWPPANQIRSICKQTLWQNLSYAYLLLNFGVAEDKSNQVLDHIINDITFDITRYGFTNGNLVVGLNPISSNILNVGHSKTYNLNQRETRHDSISLELFSNVNNGDVIQFELYVDNGNFILRDTITKVFGYYSTLLYDGGTSLSNWTNIGANSNWVITTADYYSAPSSITDSDRGNYSNASTTEIILNNNLDLAGYSDANLSFWTKWNIETSYDYAQVLISSASTTGFVPLCGVYTKSGSINQDENQPIFDGLQSTWVQENMSLNNYLGNTGVVLKVRLVSDQWVNFDGFYFDDVKINVLTGSSPTGIGEVRRYYSLIGQNQPNPANQELYIPFDLLEEHSTKTIMLEITNTLGQRMANLPVDQNKKGVQLQVGDWPIGTYFYQLKSSDWESETKKMVISR